MSENIATESTDGSPPQSSSPDSLMAPTAQLGTMASKYAHSEATPMEEDIPPVSQKPEDIARKSLEMIKDMKKQALLLFATYMNSNKSDPDSPETLQALSLYREFEQKIVTAKEAHKSMTSLFEERQDAKDLSNNLGLVRLVVPNDLPVLQLRGETLWRKKADPFDSAYDFCNTFETVLHAHGLSLNSNWEQKL
ncbi:hypothetical protein G6F57_018378 [Rhizopus arrhizus]|nr:hypothetical protein G6F41_013621 [Rhizopus arrhizus]KAG1082452.1 hypothetical protein G6F39_013636 [Rhizopus arrhizus]KAG1250299.1 hypothetical protein G6F65_018793 [Rhizopus arrhizus]KAG1442525.1 hypothetical protein G6F57_018378 [Rhizopus arrhizus]